MHKILSGMLGFDGGWLVIGGFYEAYRNTPALCSAAKRRLMSMFKIDKAVDDGMSGTVWV